MRIPKLWATLKDNNRRQLLAGVQAGVIGGGVAQPTREYLRDRPRAFPHCKSGTGS